MTLFEHGSRQLCRLAEAVGVPDQEQPRLVEVFRDLSRTWGGRSIDDTPRWSAITDDCSPFEFSVALGRDGVELRLGVEAHSEPASPTGYWDASRELSQFLAQRWSADLTRLQEIESLFRPSHHVWYAAAHATVLWPAPTPLFKVYLNANAAGRDAAPQLVQRALDRLGFAAAWPSSPGIREHGSFHHVCLDLSSAAAARVKVYVRFAGATPRLLSRAIEEIDPELGARVESFVSSVFGRHIETVPRPAKIAYTLVAGSSKPASVTCHIASYPFAGTDREMSLRLARLLVDYGIDSGPYGRAVHAMDGDSGTMENGIHNHVSLQRDKGGFRVTVYLCPRVYKPRLGHIGLDPETAWPSPLPASVEGG